MQFEPSEDAPHSVLRMCAPHDSSPVGGAPDVVSWQPRNHEAAEKLSHNLIFQQIYITMNNFNCYNHQNKCLWSIFSILSSGTNKNR